MSGKPVIVVPAKSVINFNSGFKEKLLCDGPTFSCGFACALSCKFCFVESVIRKAAVVQAAIKETGKPFSELVIRRDGAVATLKDQLLGAKGRPKFSDPNDTRVIYASPLVDVAANVDLAKETIEACMVILELTHWQIRLLSKSTLLPYVAAAIPEKWKNRLIYGVSTGTLRDDVARVVEEGTPIVSKRIASLHALQDAGLRTYAMICPSLPQDNYDEFSKTMMAAVRAERCEHVWAEPLNVRGESMTRTTAALRSGGFNDEAEAVERVSTDRNEWEAYARATFLAHVKHAPSGKLRFLEYVHDGNRDWWKARVGDGAILL